MNENHIVNLIENVKKLIILKKTKTLIYLLNIIFFNLFHLKMYIKNIKQ